MNIIPCKEGVPMITTVNISSTFNTNLCVNAPMIAMWNLLPVFFNPDKISTMVLTISSEFTSRCTALMFYNGINVLTGPYFAAAARASAHALTSLMLSKGFPVKMRHCVMNNLVGHFKLGFWVDLIKTKNGISCQNVYDPGQFPALRMKPKWDRCPKLTLLIYMTGKGVITGTRRKNDMRDVLEWLMPLIEKFKMDPKPKGYKPPVVHEDMSTALVDGDVKQMMTDCMTLLSSDAVVTRDSPAPPKKRKLEDSLRRESEEGFIGASHYVVHDKLSRKYARPRKILKAPACYNDQ
jgi:transcription initiation factor TFIID TATA-box-binding protein